MGIGNLARMKHARLKTKRPLVRHGPIVNACRLSDAQKVACNLTQLFNIFRRRALRPISVAGDNAQKPELFTFGCMELVPGHRRNMNHIMQRDRRDFVADKDFAGASNDHDRMLMDMAFQRRMSARSDLKVAELNGKISLALKKGLAGDALEVGSPIFLIRHDVHALPSPRIVRFENHFKAEYRPDKHKRPPANRRPEGLGRKDYILGIRTPVVTWMTPFDCITS